MQGPGAGVATGWNLWNLAYLIIKKFRIYV